MDSFIDFANNYLPDEITLTQTEEKFLNENFKRIEFKKNTFLIQKNEIEKYLYFIEKGIIRYWTNNSDDKEATFWFSFSGEFGNSYYSFIHNTASEFNIQTLTDSVLWRIEKELLMDIYSKSLVVNIIARKIMENIFTRKIKREISLLNHSPEERYKELLLKEKELIQNISLKHIASFIGITPQALSRIRRRIY